MLPNQPALFQNHFKVTREMGFNFLIQAKLKPSMDRSWRERTQPTAACVSSLLPYDMAKVNPQAKNFWACQLPFLSVSSYVKLRWLE